jgi:Tfp pilus assembly ATPase PilU
LASADSANDLRLMIKLAGESPEAASSIAGLSLESNDSDGRRR